MKILILISIFIKKIFCCNKKGYTKTELSDFIDKLDSNKDSNNQYKFEEIDLL